MSFGPKILYKLNLTNHSLLPLKTPSNANLEADFGKFCVMKN